MAREVVADTSVLQYLHQLRQLPLLTRLGEPVLVPQAVVDELAAGRRLARDVPDPESIPWIVIDTVSLAALRESVEKRIETDVNAPASELVGLVEHLEASRQGQPRSLGGGELEAIALAVLRGTAVVLDDALARKFARSLRIQLTGTIGVLLQAKHGGAIDSIAPLLDRLDELGFHLHVETRRSVLELAGELRPEPPPATVDGGDATHGLDTK
ncbi:DUF3368 domain-containing protein [Planctomycetota bacterium]